MFFIKRIKNIIFLFLFIFLLPITVLSAEVLQINSLDKILIGDSNRIYEVKIACLEIDPSQKEIALKWLQSELPRRSRVNIKPKGFNDGVLVARLVNIKSNEDLANSIYLKGYGKLKC